MPKKQLKKILPTHEKIKEQKMLKIFGNFLYKPSLWSLSRKKVLMGVFIGVFVCFIPMPFQMFLSSFLAILLNANLPISFILIFISNPITMPFMYYVAYELGAFLLNQSQHIQFNFHSMYDNFDAIALSLYTGSFVLGTICSILAVVVINFLWIHTVKHNRKSHFSHRTST